MPLLIGRERVVDSRRLGELPVGNAVDAKWAASRAERSSADCIAREHAAQIGEGAWATIVASSPSGTPRMAALVKELTVRRVFRERYSSPERRCGRMGRGWHGGGFCVQRERAHRSRNRPESCRHIPPASAGPSAARLRAQRSRPRRRLRQGFRPCWVLDADAARAIGGEKRVPLTRV